MIDPSIELLRIIGCICVIATHIKLELKVKNEFINFTRIIIGCLCADGVGIFWYIMGFFFFKQIPYKKRLKLLIKKNYYTFSNYNLFLFLFYKL